MAPDAPTTARARVRAELTAEIKEVARRHLAEHGASGLSLRAVAREVGMVSSAVYRYFPSRDDLLTALIVDAFDAVGAAGEEAERRGARTIEGRWMDVAVAVRSWAVAHPQEYALVYGTPVPGYTAPVDTVDPASRISLVMLRLLVDGVASGEIAEGEAITIPRVVHRDFAVLRDQVAPGVPDGVLSRGLLVWTHLLGTISYELFGHFHGLISDYDTFFDLQMRRAAQILVSGP